MVQVQRCVSVHCDQCRDPLSGPGGAGVAAHYPSEATALGGAAAAGWVQGPGGRWWCSCCAPVLTCEAEGHEFTPWQRGRAGAYRYCHRCCLHETSRLAGSCAGAGEVA